MEETLTTLNLPSSKGPTASGIFSTIKPCTTKAIDVLLSYLTFLGNVKRDRREGRKKNESKVYMFTKFLLLEWWTVISSKSATLLGKCLNKKVVKSKQGHRYLFLKKMSRIKWFRIQMLWIRWFQSQ
jgi:hypothetical protein